MPKPHRVRIIGGQHRGRRIPVPDAPGLRPTPDRVRETLFNWLGQDLSGRSTLDLFAGTGALTLEALSRGASLAVAVDRNATLIRELVSFAHRIGDLPLETHVDEALRFVARERRKFDVVFLDPPFADDPWDALLAAVAPCLADDGLVYAEAGSDLSPASFDVVRRATAGTVHYHLLAKNATSRTP
ncbi:MAG TPA: 16S rRNA (guanine(966)-N(2))-methyltransferase RsmD [Casimicrobiaceae bacterium]|nr:16S rRNA (guanine(966)-N(2))-methyltransferase RsmD [Casimicrobiaceae bacterium]